MAPEQTSSPPAPADIGLRCPHCEYNLTGLSDHRCPECGEGFDSATLQARLQGEPAPVPGWDDGLLGPLAFIATCLRTYFAPWRFGESFPRNYRKGPARVFRWAAFLVAIAAMFCSHRISEFVEGFGIVVGVLVGTNICEWLAALSLCAFCSEAAPATAGPVRTIMARSYGLASYFRGYLILSLALYDRLPRTALVFDTPIEALMIWFWWALALWSAGGRSKVAFDQLLLLLGSGLVGAFLGTMAGFFSGLILLGALR